MGLAWICFRAFFENELTSQAMGLLAVYMYKTVEHRIMAMQSINTLGFV